MLDQLRLRDLWDNLYDNRSRLSDEQATTIRHLRSLVKNCNTLTEDQIEELNIIHRSIQPNKILLIRENK